MASNIKETSGLVKQIKGNKFVKEQQLIYDYVVSRLNRITEELIYSDDSTYFRKQGAVRELAELKKILGDA